MPIYKYTLKKYLKAYSTWVIAGISVLLVVVLGGFVPFKFAKTNNASEYAVLSVAIVAAITSFLGIFTSVFAGFKSATMFKDEVEDGTFLVMLSKPVSRSKIIFFKWLALQTAIIGYTFIVALSFLVAITLFDNGHKIADLSAFGIKTLRSQILMVSLMLWMILFIISLIFSSIALLLSTRLTVGTTIGISIALGVIIPITSLVGTFTSKPAFKNISNENIDLLEQGLKSQVSNLEKEVDAQAPAALRSVIDPLMQKVTQVAALPSLTANPGTLYNLGIATNEKDSFRVAQVFDFNYQIQKLSEFASEQATPEVVRSHLNFSRQGQSLKTTTNEAVKDNPFTGDHAAQLAKFDEMLISSWKATQAYRDAENDILLGLLSFVKFADGKYVDVPRSLTKYITPSTPNAVIIIAETNPSNDPLTVTRTQAIAALQANAMPVLTQKIEDVAKSEALQKDYALANNGMAELLLKLHDNQSIISFDSLGQNAEQAKTVFFTIVNSLKNLYGPLDLWVKHETVSSFQKDQDYFVRDFIKANSYAPVTTGTTEISAMHALIQPGDSTSYNLVASAIDNGYALAKIKTIEYTNKWTILWIYLAVALALVPLAYFVVRKQDFR